MRTAVYSTKSYDREFLERAAQGTPHTFSFLEPRLTPEAVPLASDCEAVCAFVNDVLSAEVLAQLAELGVKVVALRSAGYNHVDLAAAQKAGIRVVRVPAYSPHAVAEHAVGLMLTLNRRIHRAYNRVREGNFALEGLLGFDMVEKTAGVVGTGKIGEAVVRILAGFGCRVLAHDPNPSAHCEAAGATYVSLEELLGESHIVTLHMPLSPSTHHLIGEQTVRQMRRGVMLINTSRGGLIDTRAVIEGLKTSQIGALGLDVYEEEAELFFEDQSGQAIQDDIFARLLTFPNVLITGHQAFFTHEALTQIAEVTVGNLTAFVEGRELENEVRPG